jgi:hypothetical protein
VRRRRRFGQGVVGIDGCELEIGWDGDCRRRDASSKRGREGCHKEDDETLHRLSTSAGSRPSAARSTSTREIR